jgi:hypothetical protein
VVALPCEASLELEYLWLCVCVAPLRLGGLRGKKSTPSIGWEVPVKSQRLASGRKEGAPLLKDIFRFHLRFFFVGYGILIEICNFIKIKLYNIVS